MRAIEYPNKELVALLLRAGVDANEHMISQPLSRSPLQLAVESGDFEMVQYLIEAGANVNSPPAIESGPTALQLAAVKGYLGLARHLLDRGAQVNALPARYKGRIALEGAAEWGRLDMLELLVANEAQTTGKWHRRYVGAVKMAIKRGYSTAAILLKQSIGWSQDDEILFRASDTLDIEAPEWDADFFSEHVREDSADGETDMDEIDMEDIG
ncbi:ankyrin repeat-containing domain protein [Nemania serpens]|nr:ankyrin repeat-containing domain protein [Nemania serpens]